jgi:hypothetical protein
MRAVVQLVMANADASAAQRCVAPGVHPACRPPFARGHFHPAREDRDNSAPRGAPVSNAQSCLSPDPTREMAPSWASQCLVCAAMLANLRHIKRCRFPARPQIILLKPLTEMTVETN